MTNPQITELEIIDIHNTEYLLSVFNNSKQTNEQEKKFMLINMKGVSIDRKPRKDGRWQARLLIDGKNRSVYGKSKAEITKIIYDYIKGKPLPVGIIKKESFRYTLGEWLDKFRSTYKTKKDGTRSNPQNDEYIKTIKTWDIGKMPLDKIKGVDIQEALREYEDRLNTRWKYFILLKSALKMASGNGLIKLNPCDAVIIEKYKADSYNVISVADQNRILKAIDVPKYLAAFWYFSCTGLRLDTAIKSLDDIDFEKCIIRPSKKDTATKKHSVQIPFLSELLTDERLALLKQVTTAGAEIYFRKLFKQLNIDVVIHSCRKTFASCAYHVGFKEKQIQAWLGHSTIAMTMDTYTHILENETSPILDYFKRLKEKLGL